MRRRWTWLAGLLVIATIVTIALPLAAQRGGRFGWGRRSFVYPNNAYNGQFTFVRIRYQGYSSWRADYPDMEENLTIMLDELTSMNPNEIGTNVLDLDDPELLKYPVAYLTEPGYWWPNQAEVDGLREYLDKGGFLIVDDFHFWNEWNVFENAMRQVLPNAVIEELDVTHPVFNSFFRIESLDVPYPGRLGEQGLMGEFYGIHDPNDPAGRLMVVINYNMDIGDYMEWSRTGTYAMAPTNEAYKFAINYVIYGLTH